MDCSPPGSFVHGISQARERTEMEMATHSSTLAWEIPWTEKRGRLQPMGMQRVGHDWVISLSLSPKDLLDPEIQPASLALAGRFFATEPPGKPLQNYTSIKKKKKKDHIIKTSKTFEHISQKRQMPNKHTKVLSKLLDIGKCKLKSDEMPVWIH